MNTSITSLFHSKSTKCISACCNESTHRLKCKVCIHRYCCRNRAKKESNYSKPSEIQEKLDPATSDSIIHHGDVSVRIQYDNDTFIHHGGIKIQIGDMYDYIEETRSLSWADVTRNIDLISFLCLFFNHLFGLLGNSI